ncbi:MAG: PEP-CTERM sorting domain-containing protein [Verrucomicrobia bacterium]|nr:PEP-CTERM sorting domain-containing protein [Verrucomicrobiota bacterium]
MFRFLLFLLLASLAPFRAIAFTPLPLPQVNTDLRTWTGGGAYSPLFPGTSTFNGVPFSLILDPSGNNVFIGTLDIPVGIYGVTHAYTLISGAWGQFGATVGSVQFLATNGVTFTVNLVEGVNVRDHFNGGYNNVIDGTHAIPAFDSGGARIDQQLYTLPTAFATETLLTIRFTSSGFNPIGQPFLAAVTVAAVPEPTVLPLLLAGLSVWCLGRGRPRS